MKKLLTFLLLLAALTGLGMISCAAEAPAETAEEPAEWTVLFYLCGSDLESKYSYATGNLIEIAGINYPDSSIPLLTATEGEIDFSNIYKPGKVNVVIETGGSSAWHAQNLGLDISTTALQRWQFNCFSIYDPLDEIPPKIQLVETLPLSSMADPETLTDFIRWGVQNYPAKKYALALWDHGGGAMTGLFVDELFHNDIMYLYELKQALADAGVTFETILIDACLMANLETACAIKDYGRWMVASEETVPGKGTSVQNWLQELLNHPDCDGKMLGRNICDMTMAKYANDSDTQSRSILTWSVIDLSKIDKVAEVTDRLFEEVGKAYVTTPVIATYFANMIEKAEEYGEGIQNMRDLASILHNANASRYMDMPLRNELLDALSDAVTYSIRAAGRNGALGLSICYPMDASTSELEIYSKNCPLPHYIALLDAVTGWDAANSFYESVERLPDIDTIEPLQIHVRLARTESGEPSVMSDSNMISGVYYHLYKQDDATGQVVSLGRTDCVIDYDEATSLLVWYANEPWSWPSIDDTPCSIDLLTEQHTLTEEARLYNIPIQIGTDNYFLRCGRIDPVEQDKKRYYEVYGVWENYDDTSTVISRNVIKLAQMAGQEYRVIWPLEIAGKNGNIRYMVASPSARLYRSLDVEETNLPAGTYYLEYEVTDVFLRSYVLQRQEMHWDGSKLTFTDDPTWEGSRQLTWTK